MPKSNPRGMVPPTDKNMKLALRRALKQVKLDINPNVTSFALRTQPGPNRFFGSQWIPRTYRIFKTQSAGSIVNVPVTFGDLVTAGCPTGTKLRVCKLKIWNSTSPGFSTGYIELNFSPTDTYSGVAGLVLSDLGSATALPGVGVVIPKALTVVKTASSSSAAEIINVRTAQVGVVAPANQSITIDVQVEIAV